MDQADMGLARSGVLAGLSVTSRPDGITLLAAFAFAAFEQSDSTCQIAHRLSAHHRIWINSHAISVFQLFCYWAGYPILSSPSRLNMQSCGRQHFGSSISSARVIFTGVDSIITWSYLDNFRAFLDRRAGVIAGALWVIGYLGIYAWRLPVVYQHGRYVIPTVAVFCVWGLAGLIEIIHIARSSRLPILAARAWVLASAVILLVFWILGARSFALDVAIIENEMVNTAFWINRNTPEKALIAAHDIGALGYYSDRSIIDLAGLISPEVIPFIRDEAAIRYFLKAQNADFLVTFPGWYPYLTSLDDPVYSSNGSFSPNSGGENMTVYRLLDR
jgi:hypothetical protein